MSSTNLKPDPQPKKLNPNNKLERIGWSTVAMRGGVEIVLFHSSLQMLEMGFNAVTDGRVPFDRSKVTRVVIRKQRAGVQL